MRAEIITGTIVTTAASGASLESVNGSDIFCGYTMSNNLNANPSSPTRPVTTTACRPTSPASARGAGWTIFAPDGVADGERDVPRQLYNHAGQQAPAPAAMSRDEHLRSPKPRPRGHEGARDRWGWLHWLKTLARRATSSGEDRRTRSRQFLNRQPSEYRRPRRQASK